MIRRPLPRQREKPRRKAPERVSRARIKEKVNREPNARELSYWASLPPRCLLCGREAVVHHILFAFAAKRTRRDHRYVARLCPEHHNMGTQSVHLLGSEERFHEVHGIDLVSIAIGNWEKFDG